MFSAHRIAIILCSASVMLACAKKVKVNGKDISSIKGPVNPVTAKPALLPMALGTERTYFQSRSTINLWVSAPSIDKGRDFSLSNNTTKQVLLDRQTLALDDTTETSSGINLVASELSLNVALNLMNPAFHGKFAYPSNELQLRLDADPPLITKKSIVLRDFRAGAVQVLHFAEDQQRSGNFQGELTPLTNPIVRTDKTLLITGFVPVVNH